MAWQSGSTSTGMRVLITMLVFLMVDSSSNLTSQQETSDELTSSLEDVEGMDSNNVAYIARGEGHTELVPALPNSVCSWRRNKFVRRGCVGKESTLCTAYGRSMTKDIMGKPACLDYPCEGYGNPVGFFLCNSTCLDGSMDAFGICGGDDICCLVPSNTNEVI